LGALALAGSLVLPAMAAAAGPGDYVARRFDVGIKVLSGGSLDVTETITFDFQSGTFQRVWRDIPASRTDGIEVIEARMDGNLVTRGEGPGHVVVSGRSRVRVEWQFAPAGPSRHTFELRYLARGVAYRDGDRDIVRWQFLPAEHRYAIAGSRTTIALPERPVETPTVEQHRVNDVSTTQSAEGVEIDATDIRSNGWLIADLRFPATHVAPALPAWQQRQQDAAALGPRWAMAAGGIFVAGLLVLLLSRQGYAAPTIGVNDTTVTEPPEAMPAALVAVLVSKGRTSGYQSAATLLDLADRGILAIRELPRRLSVRSYELSQVAGKHELEDHETEALTMAFAGRGDDVTMSKARGRLARGARRFAAAVNADLAKRGLLDPSRKSVRDRLTVVSITMLLTSAVGSIAVAPLIPRFQAWPFLLPLALAVSGIVGVVLAAATTPLSDNGLIQAALWRGFRRHLKTLAAARDDEGAVSVTSRWIVYGVAVGLAQPWARYLKRHPEAAPAWFQAAANDDSGAAFAAFVSSHAASSGAATGGGAAAGGGGSGAG
jgi:hypothetical protein